MSWIYNTTSCSSCGVIMTGYIEKEKEIKQKGIDEVVVLSVNDPYVMKAWQAGFGADTHVRRNTGGKRERAPHTHGSPL